MTKTPEEWANLFTEDAVTRPTVELVNDLIADARQGYIRDDLIYAEDADALMRQARQGWVLAKDVKPLIDSLDSYATCGDGCTCGDGWSHALAKHALSHFRKQHPELFKNL